MLFSAGGPAEGGGREPPSQSLNEFNGERHMSWTCKNFFKPCKHKTKFSLHPKNYPNFGTWGDGGVTPTCSPFLWGGAGFQHVLQKKPLPPIEKPTPTQPLTHRQFPGGWAVRGQKKIRRLWHGACVVWRGGLNSKKTTHPATPHAIIDRPRVRGAHLCVSVGGHPGPTLVGGDRPSATKKLAPTAPCVSAWVGPFGGEGAYLPWGGSKICRSA